jgi:hypothetical protein
MKSFRLLAVVASIFMVAQAVAIEKGQEGKVLQKRINWSNKVEQFTATDPYVSSPHES